MALEGIRRDREDSGLFLFIERLAAHSPLSSDERAALATLPTTRVQIAAHRDIVRLGERPDHSCLVDRGIVGRYAATEEAARQIVSVHLPGEMVDLHSLVAPEATAAIAALTQSSILNVPHSALRDLIALYPALSLAFWRECERQSAIGTRWLLNLGRRDARSRMAHLLCEMAVRHRDYPTPVPDRFEFPVTQEQLADMLGLTSVHTNRTLMALRSERLISFSRGYVEILDWPALSATAEFDPTYLTTQ